MAKKGKKKAEKKPSAVKVVPQPQPLSELHKEFYTVQIKDLEDKTIR